MVLVRDRSAEEGHDPVARELVDGPLKAMDPFAEDGEEAVHDPPPLLRIASLGHLHRAHDVREQHRDLLALTLQEAAGAADLLREMVRRVGARIGALHHIRQRRRWLRRRGQAAPACVAEPLAGRVRGAATRTGSRAGQGGAAPAAESRVGGVGMAAGWTVHVRSEQRGDRVEGTRNPGTEIASRLGQPRCAGGSLGGRGSTWAEPILLRLTGQSGRLAGPGGFERRCARLPYSSTRRATRPATSRPRSASYAPPPATGRSL